MEQFGASAPIHLSFVPRYFAIDNSTCAAFEINSRVRIVDGVLPKAWQCPCLLRANVTRYMVTARTLYFFHFIPFLDKLYLPSQFAGSLFSRLTDEKTIFARFYICPCRPLAYIARHDPLPASPDADRPTGIPLPHTTPAIDR